MRAPPRFQFLPCLFHVRGYRRCVSGFHQSVLLALVGQTDIGYLWGIANDVAWQLDAI